jgi:hypothetical protein
MNSSVNSICTTPLNGLSSPPSNSIPGEQARRCLFSPGTRAAMLPYARTLSFTDVSSLGSPERSSTPTIGEAAREPRSNGTITISSSPWRPWSTSLSLSQLTELSTAQTDGQHNLCTMFSPGLSTPLMQTEGQPQPNFPPAVEEFVQGNFWQEHYQTGGPQTHWTPIISYFPPEVEAFLAANPTQVYSVVVRTVQYFDFFPL